MSDHTFNLSAWALRHRSLVGFFMLMLAVMGVLSYKQLKQAEDPPFTFKVMVVRTLWPGATAREVEQQLTDKIERKLQETPYLDRVSSYSRQGESTVMVFAKDNTPPTAMPDVFYQVRKKIGDIRHTLPGNIQGPFFNDEFGDVYGNLLALTAEGLDYPALKDQAERLRDQLLHIKGISKIDLIGVQDEKIYIDLKQQKLASLGISPTTLLNLLAQQNLVSNSGFVETASERVYLTSSGSYASPETLAATPILINGKTLNLGDIAEIHRGLTTPPNPLAHFNGRPAILLGVSMTKEGDIIELGKDLRQAVTELQSDLPLGVELTEAISQPDAVKRSINDFIRALAEAVGVVLLVTFISLGLRTGMVVALSIPLVLAATFLAMRYFNIGLHKVSLGALILALGLLVDDAIIAVEMMWVKMEQGWERTRAAAFAYTNTAGPMLSGTLVTVAGFIPIALAQSAVGEYAIAFFQINAIALMISWLAAVIAIPWLGYKLLPTPTVIQHEHETSFYQSPFYERLRGIITFCVKRRRLILSGTLLLFLLSLVGMKLVPKQFFPNSTRLELNVELRLPEGASLRATETAMQDLETWLANDGHTHEDHLHALSFIGQGAPRYFLSLDQQLPATNVAQMVIVTPNLQAREALRGRLIEHYQNDASGVRANITRIENGPPVGYPVQYRISGENPDLLRQHADQLATLLRQHPALTNINFDWHDLAKVIKFDIDQEKLRLFGLSSQDVANYLALNLNGLPATYLREGRKTLEVTLRAKPDDSLRLSQLDSLALAGRDGKPIPLQQLGHWVYTYEPGILWRRDRTPTLTVRANLYGQEQPDSIVQQLAPAIEKFRAELPAGYQLAVGGSVEESGKGSQSVAAGVPLFLLAVLSVLMIQLQKPARVAMVILTAPLGLIGIALFLLVFNKPFGFMALLGTIALFGMIMRNSVILVDQIEQDIAAGHSRHTAIIEATIRRFRPITLTAAAAVLAMIPLSRNDFFGPMAVAIMGGLIVATALTLFFLPALYAAWHRVKA